MARTKEFDPDAVLAAAMELFWRQGYEATSTADLVDHLGIARASLYATFGSKHELYLKALRHYLETRDPDLVEVLSQPGPALPAVRRILEQYGSESISDPQRRGCMVVNAATERMSADPQVANLVKSSWDTLEVALTSALLRARAQGELGPDKDPRQLARFLLVFMQGLRVFGRSEPDPQRLQDAMAQAMRALG